MRNVSSEVVLELSNKWELELLNDNCIILNKWHVQGGSSAREDLLSNMVTTWPTIDVFNHEYTLPEEIRDSEDIYYVTRFFAYDSMPVKLVTDDDIGLLDYGIYVNGTAIHTPEPCYVYDVKNRIVDITEYLRWSASGELNKIMIRVSTMDINAKRLTEPFRLFGKFVVAFPYGEDYPAFIGSIKHKSVSSLQSWWDLDLPWYSGSVVYRRKFYVNSDDLDKTLALAFGKIYHMARVRINGKDAGFLGWPPYKLLISDYVRSGENTLEVEVTNSLMNLLTGVTDKSGVFGPVYLCSCSMNRA